ncbi:MAG: hypothetical protein HDT23_06325 [Ruminococcus sp.]|nr:hypothetical protein [Ruminococcus sp.]
MHYMNMALFSVNPFVFVYSSAFVIIPLVFYAVFCYKRFIVSVQAETVKNFNLESVDYIKTVAVVKSVNRILKKSTLCYNVNGQEFSIKVPYYIKSDSTYVIYPKNKPNKAILYDCEQLKKTVKKYTTLANLSIILEFIMIILTILMFILLVKSGGDNTGVSSIPSY